MSISNLSPSTELLTQVRAAFVRRNDTFSGWCKRNQLRPQNVRIAVIGGWNGPKGTKLRARVIRESGLEDQA